MTNNVFQTCMEPEEIKIINDITIYIYHEIATIEIERGNTLTAEEFALIVSYLKNRNDYAAVKEYNLRM